MDMDTSTQAHTWKPIPGEVAKEFDHEGGTAERMFFSRDGARSYPRIMIRINHVTKGENQGITLQCCLKREAEDWVEQVPIPLELLPYIQESFLSLKFKDIGW